MKRANLIIAGLLAMLGVFVLYLSKQLPEFADKNTTGPAFFPTLLVVLLFGLLVLLIGITLKDETDRSIKLLTKEAKMSYSIMGMVLIYLLVFNYLGFLVSTLIFLFTVMTYLSPKRNHLKTSVIALLSTLLVYIVFKVILLVPIPGGIFIG
jgi:putative tricarboxylic transport membrane protein